VNDPPPIVYFFSHGTFPDVLPAPVGMALHNPLPSFPVSSRMALTIPIFHYLFFQDCLVLRAELDKIFCFFFGQSLGRAFLCTSTTKKKKNNCVGRTAVRPSFPLTSVPNERLWSPFFSYFFNPTQLYTGCTKSNVCLFPPLFSPEPGTTAVLFWSFFSQVFIQFCFL